MMLFLINEHVSSDVATYVVAESIEEALQAYKESTDTDGFRAARSITQIQRRLLLPTPLLRAELPKGGPYR